MLDIDRGPSPAREGGSFGRAFFTTAGILAALVGIPTAFCCGVPTLVAWFGNAMEGTIEKVEGAEQPSPAPKK